VTTPRLRRLINHTDWPQTRKTGTRSATPASIWKWSAAFQFSKVRTAQRGGVIASYKSMRQCGVFAHQVSAGTVEHPYSDEAGRVVHFLLRKSGRCTRIADSFNGLTKDEHDTLPLSKTIRSIAVIGPLAMRRRAPARLVERRWQDGGTVLHSPA